MSGTRLPLLARGACFDPDYTPPPPPPKKAKKTLPPPSQPPRVATPGKPMAPPPVQR